MGKDAVSYCLTINSLHSLLWWILITCMLGVITFGGALLEVGRFVTGKTSERPDHFAFRNADSLQVLDGMSGSSMAMLKKAIRLDFLLMPFVCIGLITLISLILHSSGTAIEGWSPLLKVLRWFPLAAWVCDIAENLLSLSYIRNYKANGSSGDLRLLPAIYFSSVLKWFALLSCGCCLLSLACSVL